MKKNQNNQQGEAPACAKPLLGAGLPLEQQVCTLEQAKKLKELGVEFPSIAVYHDTSFGTLLSFRVSENDLGVSAYTVAELGIMLPMLPADINHASLEIYKEPNSNFKFCSIGQYKVHGLFTTEAQARAAMLIYLLENNLLTLSQPKK